MNLAPKNRRRRHLCLAAVAFVGWAKVAVPAYAADPEALFSQLDADRDDFVEATEIGKSNQPLFARLLRNGDDDRDGRLSLGEFTAALTPVRPEKPLPAKSGSKLPGADALVVVVARLDANRDGRLVRAEATGMWGMMFDRMLAVADGNKDGAIDARELAEGAPRLGIIATTAAMRMGLNVEAELAKLPAAQRKQIEDRGDYGRPGAMLADPALAAEAFDRLDANSDGQLEMSELPEPLAGRFDEFARRGDRDGDSRISRDELTKLSKRLADATQRPANPQEFGQQVQFLLKRFDRDGDGKLSIREAPRRLAENFPRADANGDEFLDFDELARAAALVRRLGP